MARQRFKDSCISCKEPQFMKLHGRKCIACLAEAGKPISMRFAKKPSTGMMGHVEMRTKNATQHNHDKSIKVVQH